MQTHPYKITLSLRKTGEKVLSLATRSYTGKVIRSNGLVFSTEDMNKLVEDHAQVVAEYDIFLADLETKERAAQKAAHAGQ